MTDTQERTKVALAVLQRLPTTIANTLIADRGVRAAYSLAIDAPLVLGESGVSVPRTAFFDAIGRLLGPASPSQAITDSAGSPWTLELEGSGADQHIAMRSASHVLQLPRFWALSPMAQDRLSELDGAAQRMNLPADAVTRWRTALESGPIDHDDYATLEADLGDTPIGVAGRITAAMQSGECPTSTLVPPSTTYFERLLGPPAATLEAYAANAKRRTDELLAWDREQGLRWSLLLLGHSSIVAGIDATSLSDSELKAAFEWVIDRGDTLSQVGAIELALPILDRRPQLEPLIVRLVMQVRDEDPTQPGGRLARLSDLIAFVAGELARTRILRGRPPFWKRLGAIAQASLIERQALDVGGDVAKFAEVLRRSTGQIFWLEAMSDLRVEPRWLPDFIAPSQLKQEFGARIVLAAAAHYEKIQSSPLGDLLLGETNSIRGQLDPLLSAIPGPLEGGIRSQRSMPPEVRDVVERKLTSEELTSGSFAPLVNCALVFQIGTELSGLAAEALRRVKYQLRQSIDRDVAYRLTCGLAIVAAVTRSRELAGEVRILARVMRRRPPPLLEVDNETEIALIAAAAHEDVREWAAFFGEWMTEVALELTDVGRAATLRRGLQTLRLLAPELLAPVARADAALASVPGNPG